jgi:hypothetical protein
MTTRDKQHAAAVAAMPEVKRLVKKFGRTAVGNCLNKLKAHEKELGRLADLKAEIAALEKQL